MRGGRRRLTALPRGMRATRGRRRLAAKLRRAGDFRLLAGFSWAYDWRQFAVLARERGLGKRKPGAEIVSS